MKQLKQENFKNIGDYTENMAIEVGYYVGTESILKEEMSNLINNTIMDGVEIFGMFCRFIVKKFEYAKTDATEIYEYIDYNAEKLFKEFEEEYFEEVKKNGTKKSNLY